MLSNFSAGATRGPALLCLALLLTAVLATQIHIDLSGLTTNLFERSVNTAPPPEVAIQFDEVQLLDLQTAYRNGFRNPNPEDPCEKLRLLPYKTLSKWRRQFQQRGFTVDKVREMLRTGRRVPHTHPTKGTTYTRIVDGQGNWIIVDFLDCVIWQVAPHNFKI